MIYNLIINKISNTIFPSLDTMFESQYIRYLDKFVTALHRCPGHSNISITWVDVRCSEYLFSIPAETNNPGMGFITCIEFLKCIFVVSYFRGWKQNSSPWEIFELEIRRLLRISDADTSTKILHEFYHFNHYGHTVREFTTSRKLARQV